MIDCAACCHAGARDECARDCVWAGARRRRAVPLAACLGSDVEPEVREPGPIIEMWTTPELEVYIDTDPFDVA